MFTGAVGTRRVLRVTCGSKERRRRGRNGVSGFDLVSLICFGGVDAARGMEGDIIGAIEQRQYGLEID